MELNNQDLKIIKARKENRAYKAGFKKGCIEGWEEGYIKGWENGFHERRKDLSIVKEEARKSGFEEGFNKAVRNFLPLGLAAGAAIMGLIWFLISL
jgi:flagellar biosynthesis/type III secretory pathway protein FliH